MAEQTSTPISIRYATESELPALARLELLAFPSSRYLSNTFPNADQQALQNYKSIVLCTPFSNPRAHFLVAIDPATDQIVAYSCWSIPTSYQYGDPARTVISSEAEEKAANSFQYSPEGMNMDIHNMFISTLEAKKQFHTNEHDIILNMLCVLPDYQGKGIGRQFLKWGMDKADELGARIYLESTPAGYPVYLKYGWDLVEECVIDYTRFGGAGSQTFLLMIRNPRASAT
ncbi:predicted protein [Uncinocarpus reesii 1704]|uniref:N-acetyltransferase domain-containing protein n=1 Tax=Uncinocarpus reesii (strain UAMH 1704) TaxID=336963 RepID=C4JZ00_UNCRE|nr:uncharacterized protein UREG_07401 [Uncinocarpus reesii 1704]EEP82536.1 predicted protein [Uncinocarpus reesii 1704]